MYSYDTKVRYSESDYNKCLTIPNIINYFQDVSVMHSESVGAGLDYVENIGRVWLLGSWRIEFLKDIKYLDEIRVSTWPYEFKSLFGYRNFTIEKNNEICVKANSTWMLFSTQKNRIEKATEQDISKYKCEEPLDMEKCKRKLEPVGELSHENEFVVPKYFIDTNGHMNNGKYVLLALEKLSSDKKIKVLEVEYKLSAKQGDIIIPYKCESDKEAFVSLRNKEDKVFANIKITY